MSDAIRLVLASLVVLSVSGPVQADVLVTGGRIAKVTNTRGANDASFVVLTEGGTGPCSGQWIYFYPSGASDPEMHKRSYAAVLMAMAAGMRVEIEATDTSCNGAYYIAVYP